MKIGLYGGSFDPIHYGHIHPVREACDALALDQVIYLPTAKPPHKRQRKPAPALARYAMVELALLAEKDFVVSTFELGNEVTYTIDTLEHFRRQHPAARLFLILGSDSFTELDTWREWRKLLEIAELAVLERPGNSTDKMSGQLKAAIESTRVHHIANTPIAASSTVIRRRIAARSDDLHQLTSPLVLDYMAKYDLYR